MNDDHLRDAGTGGLDDEALLGQLREMFARVDPQPPWLADLAKLSYDLRSIDVELAELVADSHVDEPALAVRAAATATEPRLLTFESDDLVVEVEVSQDERGRHLLIGQLVPAQAARVELRQPDQATVTVLTDELGRFSVSGLAAGPFSLVCHRADARPVASQWVTH